MYVPYTTHENSSYFERLISPRNFARNFEFFIKVSRGEISTYANFQIKMQKLRVFRKTKTLDESSEKRL